MTQTRIWPESAQNRPKKLARVKVLKTQKKSRMQRRFPLLAKFRKNGWRFPLGFGSEKETKLNPFQIFFKTFSVLEILWVIIYDPLKRPTSAAVSQDVCRRAIDSLRNQNSELERRIRTLGKSLYETYYILHKLYFFQMIFFVFLLVKVVKTCIDSSRNSERSL